jgi:hypothetical protein
MIVLDLRQQYGPVTSEVLGIPQSWGVGSGETFSLEDEQLQQLQISGLSLYTDANSLLKTSRSIRKWKPD